jgi:lysophospholipase L1-like esterase
MKKPAVSSPSKAPKPLSRKKSLVFKGIALLLPFLLLALLEALLRWAGYGHDLRLFVEDARHQGYWVMNPHASKRYFTGSDHAPVGNFEPFRKQKTPGTLRLFVLGESTTIGYPYMHNGSFHRWLQYRLLHTFPQKNIEVINLSMTAVNSYTVLGFAGEMVAYQPDAVLVYTGHNEYYGALGVGSTSRLGSNPALVRLLLKLQDFRLVQGIEGVLAATTQMFRGGKPDGRETLMKRMAADQSIRYGSAAYRRGIRQFETNMSDLCRLLSGRRIPLFISTLVSNEKDLKPFVSDSGEPAGSAEKSYQQAIQRYAAADFAGAKKQYVRAKELDLLRFRAPEAINQVIRKLPTRYPGVFLADAQALFERHSPHGIIGEELLLEHVHPNLYGYALLSEAFYQALKGQKIIVPDGSRELPLAHWLKQMPITPVDSLKGAYEVMALKGGWPFNQPVSTGFARRASVEEKIASAILAGQLSWNDAMEKLMNHYLKEKNLAGALRVAEAVMLEYPCDPTFHVYASQFSRQLHKNPQAVLYLQKAFRLQPNAQLARELFILHLKLDQPEGAIPYVVYATGNAATNTRSGALKTLLQTIVGLKAALRADSANGRLLHKLAAQYHKIGNTEVAEQYARRARQAQPRSTRHSGRDAD